jgi:Mg2+ and Co2+ transporter CorA
MDNKDNVSTIQDMSGQTINTTLSYTLSVEQASSRFIEAGVPRSPRTIIRYCVQNHLDCVKVDTERNEKYLVAEKSVETRIAELKQIVMSSHVELEQDITRHDESYQDKSRQDTTSNEFKYEMQEKIDELELKLDKIKDEKRDLEIATRVKDHVLKKAEIELGDTREQLMRFNRAIGELVTVLRLKAPEHDTSSIVRYLDAPPREIGGQARYSHASGENMVDKDGREIENTNYVK